MSTGVWNALPFNLCPMLLGLLYSSSKDGVQGDSYCLGKEARRRRETYDVYGSLECPSIQSVPYAPQTLYSSSKDGVQGKTKTVGRKDGSRKRKVFYSQRMILTSYGIFICFVVNNLWRNRRCFYAFFMLSLMDCLHTSHSCYYRLGKC